MCVLSGQNNVTGSAPLSMSAQRAVLSALISCHLVAIGVDALPHPDRLSPVVSVRHPDGNVLTRFVTPLLDTTAQRAAKLEKRLYDMTGWLRPLTRPYVATSVRQKWDMFAGPDVENHYVRLAYAVSQSPAGSPRVVRELIYPARREDQAQFAYEVRDKAVLVAVRALAQTRRARQVADPDDILALTRYFAKRYATEYLTDGRTIRRIEVWDGRAPIAPPGQRLDGESLAARLSVLGDYYEGPAWAFTPRGSSPTVGSVEREADIVWRLVFVDAP
jgi:hypothetical protein